VVGHGILRRPRRRGARPLGGLMHRAGAASRHPAARWGFGRRRAPDQRPTSLPQSRQCPS
jgi:hypothetical protein